MDAPCLLCNWAEADKHFQRVPVWENNLWRVTTSLVAPIVGFSYLEPKRHIAYITELDGEEAATLGTTLAWVTRTLREETNAQLVYVNVFGERVAHLHFNLAPHRHGDALRGGPGMLAEAAPPVPRGELEMMAQRLRRRLDRDAARE
jgi:diadenosine tetraphosphate (Ap4A) HIT family hydrolase